MAITSLPTPPSRSDPENFPERADAFMAALPRFATEANALQEHVNEAAATVDQDAAAAALSRDAAAESRSQAGQSAQAAETARQVAAQKAGEAGASAQRAQQWAEKLGAPVEGDGFSAKHWAEVAAMGAGLPVYMPGSLPPQNVGPIYIAGQGNAEWDAATGRYRVHSDIPVGAVAWWPLRTSIPAGQIPADGQTVSRATFPDLAAMVAAGTLPVVSEADWQADPLKRGSYSLGDGSTTIRLPDLNGKSAGTLGRVFLSGDGVNSAATAGLIQRDALQGHRHGPIRIVGQGVTTGGVTFNNVTGAGAFTGADLVGEPSADGINGTPRIAAETRPQNVAGAWTIQAFGAVTNPGAADAAQLASDYANLSARVQTLQGTPIDHGQCRFVYVSATECRLMPYNGNGLIIGGKQYRIKPEGASVTTSATAANGRYYVFAIDDGAGNIALELAVAANSLHETYIDGVEIKTGDSTRTLVGWLGTTAANQFVDNAGINRFVASWFNRRVRGITEAVGGTLASTSEIPLGNGRSMFNWGGEDVYSFITGYANMSTNNFYSLHLRRGGAVFVPGTAGGSGNTSGQSGVSAASSMIGAPDENAATYQMWGSVNVGTAQLGQRFTVFTNI